MADELSHHSAVTILTSDPDEINLLVGLTRRMNVGRRRTGLTTQPGRGKDRFAPSLWSDAQ